MRIGSVGVSGGTARFDTRRSDASAPNAESRALVVVAPVARAEAPRLHRLVRPEPTVIAQLFALRDGHPQMRDKRRASPEEARAAYLAASARVAMPSMRSNARIDVSA